ncbi:MAG TPA: DUF5615 family PIN-like protein [Blastocatellia bacterium]|jgi:hypothetical protein
MQVRLYIDEDAMARALVQGLRARNIDVVTVLDEGMEGRSDPEQLEYATQQGRAIYTFNVSHFCQLHAEYLAQGREHAGIIVVYRQRYSVGEQIRRLSSLVESHSAEDLRNNLRFL